MTDSGRLRSPLATIATAALAMVMLAVLAVLPEVRTVRAAPIRCNGHTELCRRRYDQVVFPATHNAMAAVDDGFTWAYQQHGIAQQLRDGVRMFLLDTHHWETAADVQKGPASTSPKGHGSLASMLQEPAVAPAGPFLCHMYCGLGATPLADGMLTFREFLDRRPHEVLSIFFEDYVGGAETQAVFDAAGLTKYVYIHPDGAQWPTLGEMIASNHRLVVFVEHHGGPANWYQYGWVQVQDTRYNVTSVADFNCGLNRGLADSPLFLLNNWIAKQVPSPDDALAVNSYGFLIARARQCAVERKRLPNFIAVNYYDQGDLFAVVNTLNGF